MTREQLQQTRLEVEQAIDDIYRTVQDFKVSHNKTENAIDQMRSLRSDVDQIDKELKYREDNNVLF